MWKKKVSYVLGRFGSSTAGDIIHFDATAADDFDAFDPVERSVTSCTFTCNKMEKSRTHAEKQNSLASVSSTGA